MLPIFEASKQRRHICMVVLTHSHTRASLLGFNCSSTYSTTQISINTPQNKNTEPQTDSRPVPQT
uniref:Uncharacterized protein n=1 Tax=Amphilophus citrinellus TaxID=61819 RepID=A0A3Q0SB67_AMPCI